MRTVPGDEAAPSAPLASLYLQISVDATRPPASPSETGGVWDFVVAGVVAGAILAAVAAFLRSHRNRR